MKNLVIYGAGGLGREVLELVRTLNYDARWNILGFVDDEVPSGEVRNGVPILGGKIFFDTMTEPCDVVFGFSSCAGKESLYHELKKNPHVSFPTIIHPSAIVAGSAEISEGCVISAMCFVSTDVKIGKCVFINVAAQVGHDAIIGDFCSIMPSAHICGNVKVGAKTLIGVNSSIHQGMSAGENCSVGMGSVVISNVPDGAQVFGNPARRLC